MKLHFVPAFSVYMKNLSKPITAANICYIERFANTLPSFNLLEGKEEGEVEARKESGRLEKEGPYSSDDTRKSKYLHFTPISCEFVVKQIR